MMWCCWPALQDFRPPALSVPEAIRPLFGAMALPSLMYRIAARAAPNSRCRENHKPLPAMFPGRKGFRFGGGAVCGS